MIFLLQAQDALSVVDVLRSDPLLYLVVALPILGIAGLSWLYRLKHVELKESRDEIKDVRRENHDLTQNIMESNKLSTEAITAQVEVMRSMRTDQKDALMRYDQKADEILKHLIEIKMRRTGHHES